MHQRLNAHSIFVTILLVILGSVAAELSAQPGEKTEPMALRVVMNDLDRNMQAVASAIAKEDWTLITELAPQIANHTQPPLSEKMRILAWLGNDARKFRSFDGQVHEAALAMGKAAQREHGEAVIAAFSMTQQSCLACHQSFRQSFMEQFYGDH